MSSRRNRAPCFERYPLRDTSNIPTPSGPSQDGSISNGSASGPPNHSLQASRGRATTQVSATPN